MPDSSTSVSDERSTGQLVGQLSEQTSRLVREEIRLAQAEMAAKARHGGLGVGLFGASGLIALYGLAAVVTAAIAALSLALPVWASALIAAGVLFVAAGVAALTGRRQVAQASPPKPEQAIANVRQDVHEAKERARRDDRR